MYPTSLSTITRSQSEAARVRQRTPAYEARLAILLNRSLLQVASPTSSSTTHNFASIQGDSRMSSISSSSAWSVTEDAANTIPVTDSLNQAPLTRVEHQWIGFGNKSADTGSLRERDGAQENNKSSDIFGDITSTNVTTLFASSDAYTRNRWRSNSGQHKDTSVPKPRS